MWDDVSLEVDARDFKRVRIKSGQTVLKLDFVSDRVPRIGLPIQLRGVYIFPNMQPLFLPYA